ncbi:hypothetical protein P8452_28743 [Trifolium repens]|nr:hypothetical protein P8452_28743 [Trifolium repens]
MKMKNGKISNFFKRKACENASTSEPVKVPRIEEVTIASTSEQVEVPPIEDVTIATPQQIEVPSIEEVTITSQRVEIPDDILNSLERDPGKRLPIDGKRRVAILLLSVTLLCFWKKNEDEEWKNYDGKRRVAILLLSVTLLCFWKKNEDEEWKN